VAVGLDAQDRVTVGEHPPQRALGSAQAPAGLVHIDRRRVADPVHEILTRLGQGVGDPGEDRVDRAGADP
jgi:hypothetical protein